MPDLANDLNHLIAGGIAGCCAKTAIAPFDRVKILFQTANPLISFHLHRPFGVFGAIGEIYSSKGFLGLYRGHSITLMRIFPYAAIQFASYERYKMLLNQRCSKWLSPKIRRFLAGSFAGLTAVTFTYPFDVARTRLIYHREATLKDVLHSLVSVGKEERFSFFQGYFATLCGIFIYAGSSFGTYEWMKSWLVEKERSTNSKEKERSSNSDDNDNLISASNDISIAQRFFCGFVAGLTGQTIAYPLETIRRRMQLRSTEVRLSGYKSILASFGEIWHQGKSIRSFYSGLSINFLKAGPSSAIAFVVYECVKRRMQEW